MELEAGAARRFPRSVALEERFAALLPEVLLGVDPAAFAELAAIGVPAQAAAHGRRSTTCTPRRCRSPSTSALLRERLAELGSATFAALTADCAGPLEVVARFLAVLELYRERRRPAGAAGAVRRADRTLDRLTP